MEQPSENSDNRDPPPQANNNRIGVFSYVCDENQAPMPSANIIKKNEPRSASKSHDDKEREAILGVVNALSIIVQCTEKTAKNCEEIAEKAKLHADQQFAICNQDREKLDDISDTTRLLIERSVHRLGPAIMATQQMMVSVEAHLGRLGEQVQKINTRLSAFRAPDEVTVTSDFVFDTAGRITMGRSLIDTILMPGRRVAIYEHHGRYMTQRSYASSDMPGFEPLLEYMEKQLETWRQSHRLDVIMHTICSHPITEALPVKELHCVCIQSLTASNEGHDNIRLCMARRFTQQVLLDTKIALGMQPLRGLKTVKLEWEPSMM